MHRQLVKINSTPAKGFDNALVDEVLDLKPKNLKSISLLYFGHRDTDGDWLAGMKKVRNPVEDFVIAFNQLSGL